MMLKTTGLINKDSTINEEKYKEYVQERKQVHKQWRKKLGIDKDDDI